MRRRAGALVAAFAIGTALVACNAVFGIDPFVAYDGGGGAASVASSSSSPSSASSSASTASSSSGAGGMADAGLTCDGGSCVCNDVFDSCDPAVVGSDAGMFDQMTFNFFTVPAAPKAGDTVEILIVAHFPLPSPALNIDGACAGHTNSSCPSPGADCGGWNILRWEKGPLASGSHKVELFINDPVNAPGPCYGNDKVASFNFYVL